MSNIISQFYGMTILMPYKHGENTTAHFEVQYRGQISKFEIDTGRMYEGSLAQDGQDIVKDWLLEHRRELKENWKRLKNNETLKPITPIV